MDTDKRDCGTIVTVTTLTVTCPRCRKRVTADFILDSHMMPKCPKCGATLLPCPICGHAMQCDRWLHGCPYSPYDESDEEMDELAERDAERAKRWAEDDGEEYYQEDDYYYY
ncbi:MAG: hypothetical protein LUC33_03060 [Prevotellaceae bacterium]|nr:hypothetical protein [Prevotellaceae bacterium]